MTVTYSLNVANAKLTGFSKLLLRWKGSIYKLLYREMIIFVGLYYCLSFSYRYLLSETQRVVFEKIALYCEAFTNLVPLTFVLGFYVSIVVTRWWRQFMEIPWPDKAVCLIAGNVHGSDERGRIIRRTLARYLLLLMTLTCQAVSTSVRRRFPTLDHIEEAGIMTKEERIVFDEIPGSHGKWWAPTVWFTNLVVRARKEGRIKDDNLLKQILDELHVYRCCCGMMFAYDWISIPLVYTQTVTIATYTYFLATVMGRQYLDPSKGYSNHDVDLYIPVFTIFEFFFFMGWLKVAEQLINPYGEDDDDFELNWCLDRNLLISFWIVDEMHNKHPRLVKDMYWDDAEPTLPYTKSSADFRSRAMGAHLGSAMDLAIDPEEAEFMPMETIMEEDNDQTYSENSSRPQSPNNDLMSMGSPGHRDKEHEANANNNDTTSHSGLKFITESFKGSRLFNMILGQSTENVSGTPKLGYSTSTEKGALLGHQTLNPPFLLKTPRRRTRAISVGEGSLNPEVTSLSEIPNAPSSVTMSHLQRTPTMHGQYTPMSDRRSARADSATTCQDTPMSGRRSFRADSTATVDTTGDSTVNMSTATSIEGFKFPTSFVPPGNTSTQQFFQHLRHRDSIDSRDDGGDLNIDGQADLNLTPVISGRNSRVADTSGATIVAMDSMSLGSVSIREGALDCLMTSPTTNSEGAVAVEESPYEPNLSNESLTAFDSDNQSTVTSITELIKKSKGN